MYFTHHSPESDSKSIPLIANPGKKSLVEQQTSSSAQQHSTSQQTATIRPTNSSSTNMQPPPNNDFTPNPIGISTVPSSTSSRPSNNTNKIMNAMNQQTGFTGQEFEDFDSSKKAIGMAMVAIGAYLVLGTVVFGLWMDGWTAVDAVYYTVATFTTVGYGDLYPETEGQRIFGIFFVTGGIMIIGGVVLGILFESIFNMFEQSVSDHKDCTASTFMKKFDSSSMNQHDDYTTTTSPSPKERFEDDPAAAVFGEESNKGPSAENMLVNFVLAAAIVAPALFIGHFEGWTVGESIYFSIVTATTVGYGDLSPQLMGTRLVAVFYLPLCIGIMAKILSQITSVYMDRKAKEAENKFLNRTLTLDDLQKMDFGGDGTVNGEEFLAFMLVAMGKVDQESIDQIKDLFERLDVDDDNCLEISDVMVTAYGDEEAKTQRVTNGGKSRRADDFQV